MPIREFQGYVSRVLVAILSMLFILVFCVDKIEAQQATALLTGTVKDSSGAVLADTKVTLKNSATNIARTVSSDKNGDFLLTSIPIGSYEVAVERPGFKRYGRKGITLEINQN